MNDKIRRFIEILIAALILLIALLMFWAYQTGARAALFILATFNLLEVVADGKL